MTAAEDWIAFSEKLLAEGYAILGEAQIELGPKGAGDPQILACTLAARSLSHMRAVRQLCAAGLVVEARIITRNIFENSFWIAGLAEDGDAFAQRMLDDEINSRQRRGAALFSEEATRPTLDESTERKLREWLRASEARHPKPKALNPKSVAGMTDVRASYVFYSQLSADAAHPSLQALNRYIVSEANEIRGLDSFPFPSPSELEETANLAAMALIGALVGTAQVLDLRRPTLHDLANEYLALAGRQAAEHP
jgi:hypothetical protein